MRYLSGLVAGKGNLIARGSVTVSDENSLYPKANLGSGLLSDFFQFGTAGADRLFSVDLSEVPGGTFEGASIAPWIDASSGGGSAAQDAVTFHSGAKSLKCIGGASGIGKAYVDLVVRTGERRVAAPWLYGGGGSIAARYQIQDLGTGKYLQPGGASWGAATDLFTRTAASWAEQGPLTYQVEGWSVRQLSLTTLRFIAYTNQNGTVYFDDVADWAQWNLLAIFGHNHAPVVVPQLDSSPDNSAWTTRATLTPYFPSYYTYLSTARTERYARCKLAGTNVAAPTGAPFAAAGAAPLVCEAVLGYVETAATYPDFGHRTFRSDPQIRSEGAEYAFLQRQAESIGLEVPTIGHRSEAALLEQLQDLWRRSRGDTILIVPIDGEAACVIGRLPDLFDDVRSFLGAWETRLALEPLPLPSVVT